jgi:hypothetical protein
LVVVAIVAILLCSCKSCKLLRCLLALFFGHGLFFLDLSNCRSSCRTPLRNSKMAASDLAREPIYGRVFRGTFCQVRSFPTVALAPSRRMARASPDIGRFDTLSRE